MGSMRNTRGRLHKATSSIERTSARRSSRRQNGSQHDAPVSEVFHELLSEATSSRAAGSDEDSKPLKKRKTTTVTRHQESSTSSQIPRRALSNVAPRLEPSLLEETSPTPARAPLTQRSGSPHRIVPHLQTVEDSDESDDSDQEWEDALAQGDGNDVSEEGEEAEPEIGDLSITIGSAQSSEELPGRKKARRRGITSVDKKLRLDVHKMHVLCLLYHTHRRNAWCNDTRIQTSLRKILPAGALTKFVPMPEYSQYQASKQFLEGLKELRALWTNRFSVTALGMHRSRWLDSDAEVQAFADFGELDAPMDKDDFRRAATSLQGSQDVGAQLFCALLRGIGVETRLICSLQCLPFASTAQTASPQKPSSSNAIYLDPYNKESTPSPVRTKPKPTSSRSKRPSRLERALGERHPSLSKGVAPKQRKKYHTGHPVYWTEAFNSAQQRWVTIDTMSTFTVDKPDKLEPPLNFSHNSLVYAIAFEDDLSAKDVTRRYAKAYNAKTRKFRVDCTEAGSKWWRRALEPFRRKSIYDRDQVEDAALARKEAAEGIPKNVQDFKNHAIYVLERHLRHNEVIHPMHSVGKVNVGTSMNPKMESIYRRKDVHVVRSADKWYRLGRDVIGGQQPLKHAKPKKNARRSIPPDVDIDGDQQEDMGAGLYAQFQTELYIPPPVVGGRVPRNAYGNLDVYVPSMVPEGGAHIRHKLASKAARIVGVDYADAVTGFNFKGRHGTAVVQGIIVAEEFQDAVEEVIHGMEYAQAEAEESQRSLEALGLWRRFYIGLKIAQRVNAIEIDGETGPVIDVQEHIEREDKALMEEQLAGGFFMDDAADRAASLPPVPRQYLRGNVEDDDEGPVEVTSKMDVVGERHHSGGFVPSSAEESKDLNADEAARSTSFGSILLAQQQPRSRNEHHSQDDFLSEEDDDEDNTGGGSIRELSSPGIGTSPLQRNTNENLSQKASSSTDLPTKNRSKIAGSSENDPNPPTKDSSTSGLRQAIVQVPHHVDEARIEPSDFTATETQPSVKSKVVSGDLPARLEVGAPFPSSPSETGSLPLEDPDDEDAEPDWLLDAT